MKKLYFSALLSLLHLLSSGSSFHFNGSSSLFLSLHDHSPFQVEVDGSPQTFYGPVFQLQDISPGLHHFRITQRSATSYGNRRFYSLRTVFQGSMNLEPFTEVTAVIDDFQNFRVIGKRILTPVTQHPANHYHHSCCQPYQQACLTQCIGATHHNRSGHNQCLQNHSCSGGYGGNHYYPAAPVPMRSDDFMALLNTLSRAGFESRKMEIALQAVSANHFSSDQAKQLASAFTFESGKVEIAKAAYSRTVDRERYFVVNDAFNFSSSITELNRHIAGTRLF